MRRVLVLTAAALALGAAGCSGADDTTTQVTPTPLPTASRVLGPTPCPGGCGGSPTPVPTVSGTPIPSETIRVAGETLVTHVYIPVDCGVEWLQFEGDWYRTKDPLKEAPEGWTPPTQDGDVRIISKRHLRYEPYGVADVIDFYATNDSPEPCG